MHAARIALPAKDSGLGKEEPGRAVGRGRRGGALSQMDRMVEPLLSGLPLKNCRKGSSRAWSPVRARRGSRSLRISELARGRAGGRSQLVTNAEGRAIYHHYVQAVCLEVGLRRVPGPHNACGAVPAGVTGFNAREALPLRTCKEGALQQLAV